MLTIFKDYQTTIAPECVVTRLTEVWFSVREILSGSINMHLNTSNLLARSIQLGSEFGGFLLKLLPLA